MRLGVPASIVCVVALLGAVVPLGAQSLGDVARREAERRKTLKDDGKVLTNKDVPRVPQPETPPAPADTSQTSADKDQATPADGDKAKTAEPASAAKDAAGGAKDENYWRDRQKALQEQLERDEGYVTALQSRVNALTTDFVNRDDPAQRDVIARDRQKTLDEMVRLNTQIVAEKKAISDFEEEARRAGVPPGWLR
jgi:hypothetical protein